MFQIKPFSDNVIFYDSEFTSLDPYKGEIISIGLVKPDGGELYLELEYDPKTVDPWVNENILPLLEGDFISREEARKKIADFIGEAQPYMVSYVNQYDTIYWYKLFQKKTGKADKKEGEVDLVKWLPIDFASLLFFTGFNPESFLKQQAEFLSLDLKERKQHHALDDARLLKEIYFKFFDKINE